MKRFFLFHESKLTVLKLFWKDKFVLADLPLLLSEFDDFTPVWIEQHFYMSEMNFLKQIQTRFL